MSSKQTSSARTTRTRRTAHLFAAVISAGVLVCAPQTPFSTAGAAHAAAAEVDDMAKQANALVEKAALAYKAQDYAGAIAAIEAYRGLGFTPAAQVIHLEGLAAIGLGEIVLGRNLLRLYLATEGLTDADRKVGEQQLASINDGADAIAHGELDNALLHPQGKLATPKRDPAVEFLMPPYPRASLTAKEEGRVVLDLFAARDGRIYDAKVRTTSGFPKLDQAAVDTAMTSWRFKPGTIDEVPVAMWFPFAFRFTLPADAK